jgi:hypothetical protein
MKFNLNLKMTFLIIIGVTGYGVWALMAYLDPSVRGNFLNFNISMAVGTIGLVLRDMKSDPTEKLPDVRPSIPASSSSSTNGETQA